LWWGFVQLQNADVSTPAQLAAQAQRIVALVGKARQRYATRESLRPVHAEPFPILECA
jgi:hypothetical protein